MKRAARASLPLLALLLISALACSNPETATPEAGVRGATPAAADIGEYRSRLEDEAGVPASPARVLELARDAERAIEARMNRIAAALHEGDSGNNGNEGDQGEEGEEGDWRPAFVALSRSHPRDVDALLASYREELEQAQRFLEERDLVGLPPERPAVAVAGNLALRSAFPLALYLRGKLAVTTAATLEEDPSYLANHCRVCIPPLVAHEAYPGHHVAFYHLERAWRGSRARDRSIASEHNRFFIEGWGLYAEVLMLELGYYRDPASELGAWRMLLLRALRAAIDARLHSGELTAAAAVDLYVERLLMSRDAAETEVRRHLSEPTMKTSYFAGLLQLLELRHRVLSQPQRMAPRAFHDRLLAQPERRSIPEIARYTFGIELGPLGEAEVPWPWGATAETGAGTGDLR